MSLDVNAIQDPDPDHDATVNASHFAQGDSNSAKDIQYDTNTLAYHALGYPEDDGSSTNNAHSMIIPQMTFSDTDTEDTNQANEHVVLEHVTNGNHARGFHKVTITVEPSDNSEQVTNESEPDDSNTDAGSALLEPWPPVTQDFLHPTKKTTPGYFVEESPNGHRYYCHSSSSISLSSSSCFTDDGDRSSREPSDTLPSSMHPPVPSPPLQTSPLQAMKSIRKKLPDVKEEASVTAISLRHVVRHASRHASRKFRPTTDDSDDTDSQVMIGTPIGEDHRNYQLMYDMLTGIRIAVGRVSAKRQKELNPTDFRASHKLVFDVIGNELTPGVKYDFKFKDYAPWVFRHLREKFHIDAADYMMSLTNEYILSELGSPGKSGSFFYYSRDYRFIIKTIHHTEHRFLCKILSHYYQHVCENPDTLLCRFYGLHRIKLPRGRKIHFVVMSNVFPANKDIHETYDLKGSLVGRLTHDEEVAANPNVVLKDQNWLAKERKLELGPDKRSLFLQQLERDAKLLMKMNIMDYSLLIGIHDLQKGNTERLRDQNLQMVQPGAKEPHSGSRKTPNANAVRKSIRHSNVTNLDSSRLSKTTPAANPRGRFSADDGGFRSTDEFNQPSSFLYFIGVIDILTPYNAVKKTEHAWKSLTQDKHGISAVHPEEYGERFLRFIKDAVRT